jgi:hypothetical protein
MDEERQKLVAEIAGTVAGGMFAGVGAMIGGKIAAGSIYNVDSLFELMEGGAFITSGVDVVSESVTIAERIVRLVTTGEE